MRGIWIQAESWAGVAGGLQEAPEVAEPEGAREGWPLCTGPHGPDPLTHVFLPVCRKFLGAHPEERGRLWEVEPPGAWGQRDSIWLKVQPHQSRLSDCELSAESAPWPPYPWGGSPKRKLVHMHQVGPCRHYDVLAVQQAHSRGQGLGAGSLSSSYCPFLVEPHLLNLLIQDVPNLAESEAPRD